MSFSDLLDDFSKQIFTDKIANIKVEEKSILQETINIVDMRGYYPSDKYSNESKDYAFTSWDKYQLDNQKIFEQELFWLHFFTGQHKELNKLSAKEKQQMKALIREGVPDSYRGQVYCYLLNVPLTITPQQTETYTKLLSESAPNNGKGVVQISKDIDRTMPTLNFFRSEKTLGQLFRLLKAYETTGKLQYTQGMNFPAAVFLYYLPEVSAFFCFQEFMERFGYFILGDHFQQTEYYIYVIKHLTKKFNKQLSNYMEQTLNNQQDILYFSWIVGFFSSPFCMDLQLRLFEQLLFEGKKIFIKVPIALLSYAAQGKYIGKYDDEDEFQRDTSSLQAKSFPGNGISVLSMPEYTGVQFLQDVGRFLENSDWFINEHLLKVKFSRKIIEQYRDKYQGEKQIVCSTTVTFTSQSTDEQDSRIVYYALYQSEEIDTEDIEYFLQDFITHNDLLRLIIIQQKQNIPFLICLNASKELIKLLTQENALLYHHVLERTDMSKSQKIGYIFQLLDYQDITNKDHKALMKTLASTNDPKMLKDYLGQIINRIQEHITIYNLNELFLCVFLINRAPLAYVINIDNLFYKIINILLAILQQNNCYCMLISEFLVKQWDNAISELSIQYLCQTLKKDKSNTHQMLYRHWIRQLLQNEKTKKQFTDYVSKNKENLSPTLTQAPDQ